MGDLKGWKSNYGRFTGRWLAEKMFNMTVSYDVEWQFCRKNETATKILEIVGWKNEGIETGLQNNELQDGTDDDHDGGFAS